MITVSDRIESTYTQEILREDVNYLSKVLPNISEAELLHDVVQKSDISLSSHGSLSSQ